MPAKPILKREGVQLAYHVDPGKLSRLGKEFFIQPKLNGERCRVEWFQGEPVLLSSYNNPFPHLQHIKEQLIEIRDTYNYEYPFDGELYIHGWPRERIDSAIRCPVNYNPENKEIQFHVFDIASQEHRQDARLKAMIYILKDFASSPVTPVPTLIAEPSTWMYAATEFIDIGYEGAVLRKTDSLYTPKRSVSMLKFKPTATDEYLIINVLEAISQEGDPKGMVGAFTVQDSDGNAFNVGAGKLTHPERISYWQQRQELIGKQLTVKHESLKTTNNIPVCAVAIGIQQA